MPAAVDYAEALRATADFIETQDAHIKKLTELNDSMAAHIAKLTTKIQELDRRIELINLIGGEIK